MVLSHQVFLVRVMELYDCSNDFVLIKAFPER